MRIQNAKIYRDGGWSSGDLYMNQGIFCSEDSGGESIDAQGRMAVPGFIDIHTHGAFGNDVNDAQEDQYRRIAHFFASQGTTAWNASILTDTPERTGHALDVVRELSGKQIGGAELLGAHLEGPFLSAKYKGAMPETLLRAGDADLFREYQKRSGDCVRYLTVAPEREGVEALIAEISDEVTVAIGHSAATYAQAQEAIRNGARCATHTFNAMRPLEHHEPGILGAVLESDIYCEMICDGRHLAPATVRLLIKTKGWDRVIAVTDSIMAAGLPDGTYHLGINEVFVHGADATLADGTRAGSTLTSIQAFRNLMEFTGESPETVLPAFTINPARALRIDDHKGKIEIGYDADLVLLDERYQIVMTIVGGEIVYRRS
ncbi:MAG: N-acetylglucosamine-6-phosphate deacetylase [Peptoniphilaceae bacterium]|nr:N-acetylglucosamine-6-phosphate deacetylase [Peptoniphilaceae bacterium]MDD7542819.1 N-acetylglucosamine-6-phosphate deacetylase [Peptoniphilaceae bacterium]MDY3076337.1 N-acetylglucosamine-6-phosphate deacetylase [Peptoniphilaceae bacterium]MDY5765484.1 N-acetylglucosamine-6-phosphate deacetylase [Peptoniphilaceae bacterium]MDY5841386.1 N-acetylglucosamine-6-phosphate deacetylase [Peptoniphilaceae bacterium]